MYSIGLTPDSAQPASSGLLHPGISSLEPEYEDPLAQLADESQQQPFTTNKSLQTALEQRQEELLQDRTRSQYLVFTSVPPAQAARLSDDSSETSKFARFSFNADEGILIARIVPNPEHQLAISRFSFLIADELSAMNVFDEMEPVGSATFVLGNWLKEADSSWGPAAANAKPTFVVEAGLPESARQLALDACGWLKAQLSSVKVVLTISIKRDAPEIILRRWELVPPRHNLLTKPSAPSARRTAILKFTRANNETCITGESYTDGEPHMDGTTTTTTQLVLPFDKIVGRPPRHPLERDLVIPENELREFAQRIWRKQGLL
ncbi:hypothetical protein N7535_005413 [Penicillium sp. DV-2018c]|nr:hypothetical protein N7535_005413 [Penicillium sp. DV-2018c]